MIDSKLQVSWNLLSIQADLNNAVVWMVSTHPSISESFNPSTIFCWMYRVLQLQLESMSPSCSLDFSFLYQCLGTYLYFPFSSALPGGQLEQHVLSFFVDSH